jgi:hypothetical protein
MSDSKWAQASAEYGPSLSNGMVGGERQGETWLSKVSNSAPFSSLDKAVVGMHQVNDDYVILVSSCCEGIAKVTLKAGNLSPFPKSPPLAQRAWLREIGIGKLRS